LVPSSGLVLVPIYRLVRFFYLLILTDRNHIVYGKTDHFNPSIPN